VRITYYALNAAAAYKPAYLYASNAAFAGGAPWSSAVGMSGLIAQITAGPPIGAEGAYATVTFDLTTPAETVSAVAALTSSTIYLGFGQSGGVTGGITPLYFIDDITLIP
jgi:hypothetical protein